MAQSSVQKHRAPDKSDLGLDSKAKQTTTKLAYADHSGQIVCLLLLLHGLCGVFLISCARLYWFLEHPYLEYYADLLAPSDKRHFKLMGTALGCIGALHFLRPVEIIIRRARNYHGHAPVIPGPSNDDVPAKPTAVTAVPQRRKTTWAIRLFEREILKLASRYLRWITAGMELAQIVTQVYQAYHSSHLIGRVWINHCYVAIVVIYCWTTPLMHHLLQRYSTIEGIACMTIDITLNICYSILLPLVIFIPYMQQYEPKQYSFDLSLIYGDVSFGNLILENQSIFALSLLECGSKLVPHISIYLSLRGICSLVEETSEQAKSRELLRPRSLQKRSLRKLGAETTVRTYCNLQLTAYKCVQYFFVFVGAVILVVHILAVQPRSGAASSGCKDARYPWFTSKYSCAIYEFNCYRQESVTPEETTLDFLNEGTLTVLLLTHCPALVVPKSIQNFPNLLGMEIYNSTIVEWSKEAALSPAIHQKMVFFVLSLINMTGLPDGIVQPLPEKLQDIEITTTNLTSLPGNLHETWYAMSVLYLEYSQFQVFPETLYKMEGLSDFSMIGNQLEHVPDLLSLKSELFFLALSHNPLKSLPSAAESDNGLGCEYFSLEGTNLEEMPEWMDTSIGEVVYLSGSPVCAPRSGGESAITARSGKFVCDQVDDRGDGRYPRTMMKPLRQL